MLSLCRLTIFAIWRVCSNTLFTYHYHFDFLELFEFSDKFWSLKYFVFFFISLIVLGLI